MFLGCIFLLESRGGMLVCTAGEPWIIHGKNNYTMRQIDPENQKEMLMQQKKCKASEGWLKCPQKLPYYRSKWCLGELYNKKPCWTGMNKRMNTTRKSKVYEKRRHNMTASVNISY
jgi:hypothetical protein